MARARQIVVDIVGDSKEFTKSTESAIKATTKMGGVLERLDRRFASVTSKNGLIGSILGGVGIGAGLGVFSAVTKGVGMVTDAIGNSITAASDQAEAMSKVNVVFGDQAKVIQAWARTASTSMGMSETAALSAAGTLGNLFDALGIAEDASADMSTTITQLAADLASFNNVPVADAIAALQAGLVGETEPMRRFGSNISAARVEAYALAQGMAKTKNAITDSMKVQARYALILEDTKNAQGDFARTSDGLANSQKTLDARMNEAMVSIGSALAPVMTQLVTFASEVVPDIISGLGNLGDAFNNLNRFIDPGVAAIQDFEEAVRAKAEAMGYDATQTLAWVRGEEARAKVEAERARTTAAIAKIDQQMADITANATAEIEQYAQAIKEGGDAEQLNNIIMERKLQLNTQLGPLMTEKNRLLGIEAEQQKAATEAARGATEADQRATEAMKAYTAAKQRDVQMSGILTGAWTGMGEAAEDTVPLIRSVGRAVKQTTAQMFRTMAEAKDPWREAWRKMAAWAKNPFSPEKFEDYISGRARAASRKARQSFGAERKRWREIASAYRWIAKQEWIDPMTADLEAIMAGLRVASRMTKGAAKTTINGTDWQLPGNNASGTSNWRGGWSWVGERGPELMKLPGGTKIKSNPESMAMASGGGSTYNITVNVAPGGDLVAAGKMMVQAIQQYERRSGKAWRAA
jgi:hypothetical protein